MLGAWWRALLDLIYPPKCPVCRNRVATHGMWCRFCLGEVLSVRTIDIHRHGLRALDSCVAVCDYTGGLKRLIHDMKFRSAEHYGVYLTWLLTQAKTSHMLPISGLLIPVPLDQKRFAKRGFNQTERIFKPWAQAREYIWTDCLERIRPTQPQWQLGLKARRENIKGAFGIKPEFLQSLYEKNVLLVDDIFTTGITMDECARTLKKAGTNHVYGLVLASGA